MLTIKTRIILAYTLAFGLMLAGLGYFIYVDTREAETAKLDARLESTAARIANELGEREDEPHTPATEAATLKEELGRRPGLHARLVSPDGAIIAGDSVLGVTGAGLAPAPAHGGERYDLRLPDGSHFRCLRTSIEIDDANRPVLELGMPLADLEENLRRLLLEFMMGIPLALVVMALAVYAITTMAFRPIMGMVEIAGEITALNLHRRLVLPRARDEVRHLGETLNGMIERIEAAFRSQKQFVADASHEIRTPLTAICSELEFAAGRTTEPQVKESIETSLLEIDRLTRLAEGLLLLAKLDAAQLKLNLEVVRLDELLVESVQLVGVVARKKEIRIKVDVQDAVEMQADRDKMKRIFVNLLDNAVKYSGPRTVVTASLARDGGLSGTIVVQIADEGPGIPPSVLPHVFTRFYRADPSRSEQAGAGLGLAIVQQLVGLHGGTVTVSSELSKGTTFRIALPAQPAGD